MDPAPRRTAAEVVNTSGFCHRLKVAQLFGHRSQAAAVDRVSERSEPATSIMSLCHLFHFFTFFMGN